MPPKATVVDPWHWLTESGDLPDEPRLRSRALRVAQCIEAGGPIPRGHVRETLIPCRRRPEGEACLGLMWVAKEYDDILHAFCLSCRSAEFEIHNGEDTLWADGMMEPMPMDDLLERPADDDVQEEDASPTPDAPPERDQGDPLSLVLAQMGSMLSAATVRDRLTTAQSPIAVVEDIMASLPGPPNKHAVERLLPILMNLWNATPRPELGGRSPSSTHVHQQPARRGPKVGRNAPCPCGSGKKYKRCCGAH